MCKCYGRILFWRKLGIQSWTFSIGNFIIFQLFDFKTFIRYNLIYRFHKFTMTELFINMFLKKPISTLETLLTDIGTLATESENPMICPNYDTL